MTRYLGDDGVVTVDGTNVAQVRSFSFNEEGSRVPVPAMGDGVKQALAGKPEVTGECTVWFDDADGGQELVVQGNEVALILRHRGTGSGLPERNIAQAEILSVSETVEVEAGLEMTFTWVANSTPSKTAQT